MTKRPGGGTRRSLKLVTECLARGVSVKRRRWRTSPRGGSARTQLDCAPACDQVPGAPTPTRTARRTCPQRCDRRAGCRLADVAPDDTPTGRSSAVCHNGRGHAYHRSPVVLCRSRPRPHPHQPGRPDQATKSRAVSRAGADRRGGRSPDRRNRSAPLRSRGGDPVHGRPASERGSRPGVVRHRPRGGDCARPPGGRRQC